MFERFTGGARAAVVGAQQEARDLGQSPIGTEHVLLALLADADTPVARLLAAQGVDATTARAEVRRRTGTPKPDLSFTDGDDEDKAALRTIGIDLDAVRAAVEESFGPGALDAGTGASHDDLPGPWWRRRHRQQHQPAGSPRGHIPLTPRAKKVLELSLREALALKHGYIGTEHVLLGVLREGQGLAVRILSDEGVELDHLRDLVFAELQRAA